MRGSPPRQIAISCDCPLWRFYAVRYARVESGEKEGFADTSNESCNERAKKNYDICGKNEEIVVMISVMNLRSRIS
jgi:hypothetical protein